MSGTYFEIVPPSASRNVTKTVENPTKVTGTAATVWR
jgi:hypothetical protein